MLTKMGGVVKPNKIVRQHTQEGEAGIDIVMTLREYQRMSSVTIAVLYTTSNHLNCGLKRTELNIILTAPESFG